MGLFRRKMPLEDMMKFQKVTQFANILVVHNRTTSSAQLRPQERRNKMLQAPAKDFGFRK